MNKQEAIKRVEELYGYSSRAKTVTDIISQIHEPQKVVVPKFVAEWIERVRKESLHLFDAYQSLIDDDRVKEWFINTTNFDLFARAWLDGYEVEKEKLYIVEFPTGQQLYKNYPSGSSKKQIVIKFANPKDKDGHFIKWELEKAGFGWVFDCNGVKVVEVEDER
ncbi:DUF1642 domain-containing protein [Streptococcus suis]|uniref:DUF1642 domain-containing protein n=1 Tax=Streptococcus suis TaxID=1307 RepID=UPI0019607406|nr:DUF1642 domain-containing protein [Streptococcus suis]MBM7180490.1 DUF1642 domain-containing protein [Streptococcus suis]